MTDIRPLRDVEREAITNAMLFHLNYTLAAAKLGISARTVKRRMREYGYTLQKLRQIKAERTRQGIIKFLAAK